MAISSFSASSSGSSLVNDFSILINGTGNNVVLMPKPAKEGSYVISTETGDSSYDIYCLSDSGEEVGYTNGTTISPSGEFSKVIVLGVVSTEIIRFAYAGITITATEEGTASGGGPYIESVSPSVIPNIDDTTTVTGGNFADDVEVYFVSESTTLSAKSVTKISSTSLIATRPDAFDLSLSPYDVKVINPGATEPSTALNILVGAISAGGPVSWSTGTNLQSYSLDSAYSQQVSATDSDGSVVTYLLLSGTLPAGFSMSSSGLISGTTSDVDNWGITVRATDEGGNFTDRSFLLPGPIVMSGGTESTSGGYVYRTFTSSDTLSVTNGGYAEILLVSGGGTGGSGGKGGSGGSQSGGGGGGGAGGYRTLNTNLVTGANYTVAVGGGGSTSSINGTGVSLSANGGGTGGSQNGGGGSGGSGGGAGGFAGNSPGAGTSGQGNTGGAGSNGAAGGGGGGSSVGTNTSGGSGSQWLNDSYYAGGGGGGRGSTGGGVGGGGGGAGDYNGSSPGQPNTGGGGGGAAYTSIIDGTRPQSSGGSGVVIIRYSS
jgi:hypothetical protein